MSLNYFTVELNSETNIQQICSGWSPGIIRIQSCNFLLLMTSLLLQNCLFNCPMFPCFYYCRDLVVWGLLSLFHIVFTICTEQQKAVEEARNKEKERLNQFRKHVSVWWYTEYGEFVEIMTFLWNVCGIIYTLVC